jgi:hypothetical protein
MNFFAQRRSPSRFVYQYPLYQSGYTNEKIITEFLKDLIHHKPCLIIDTKDNSTPLYNFPVSSDEIQAGIVYLQSHYPIKEHINSWTVYQYVDSKDDDGTP